MPKLWKIKPQKSQDIVEQLLANRGLTTKAEREEFFNPKLDNFNKEFNLPGIEKAKRRILKAIEDKEQITIFGDYDVDGLCATSLMYYGLSSLGAKVLPYIPHREKEGYGLSISALESIKSGGTTLIITVDNGIVATEQAKKAKELGMDLIITDHHTKGEVLPEALAIVHSNKLCGAAVAWCLVGPMLPKSKSHELLDLVGVATICDMMPLLGVNRALVKIGLGFLQKTKKVGLKALLNECNLVAEEASAFHVSHILGPRLNAVGRLEHSIDALRLLCTKDPLRAKKLAHLLCEANDQKKKFANDAIEEAVLTVSNGIKDDKIFILDSKNWIPGIIGLVAARISEDYKRPVIAISKGEEFSKGSARSISGVNIVDMLKLHSNLLIDIGGHPAAAGFTIKTKNIDLLKDKLLEFMKKVEVTFQEELQVEAELDKDLVNKKLYERLCDFEPHGLGNPQPIFASFNLKVDEVKKVGEGKHLKLKAEGIDAIAFSFGAWGDILIPGQNIDLAYTLDLNKFNGREYLQLKVVDMRLS